MTQIPPSGWISLAFAFTLLALVSARACVLGTEPDSAAGGKVKFVWTLGDLCTCTDVRLGGHNTHAPPRSGLPVYIDTRDLSALTVDGIRAQFSCTANQDGIASTGIPRVPTPAVTPIYPTSTPDEATTAGQLADSTEGPTAEVTMPVPEQSTLEVTTAAHGSTPETTSDMTTVSACPLPTEAADCQAIYDGGCAVSGVYTIQQAGQVYCRMESGKGYIVFQRRIDGAVDFNRNWQDYADGFGDPEGEFWLGNAKLRSLTEQNKWELVITLRAFGGDEVRVRYGTFSISGDQFDLDVGDYYDGVAGDSLNDHKRHFSTHDRDNDGSGMNCAVKFRGGWWFKECDVLESDLNGEYSVTPSVSDYMGIQWVSWRGYRESLQGCEMMMRRTES